VGAYEAIGPKLAETIREREQLRSLVRTLLSPIVTLAQALDD
jgi:hypothetical protein